jgi:DNA-binding IclR family transcriptional regulator
MSQSAERTLDLLIGALRSTEPPTALELAERTGLDKSTAGRLLMLLVERGLLSRVAGKRYVAGPGFIAIASEAVSGLSLLSEGAKLLPLIRDQTGETVSLHVLNGMSRVCINGLEARHPIRRGLVLGETVPVQAGVTGQVMIAFQSPWRRAEILAALAGAEGADETESGVRAALERGYGYAVGARVPDVGALAAPLRDQHGHAHAVVSVAGPAYRWTEARMAAYGPELLRHCDGTLRGRASGNPGADAAGTPAQGSDG